MVSVVFMVTVAFVALILSVRRGWWRTRTAQALAWGDEVASQVHMRHETTMRQSPAEGPSAVPTAVVKLPSSLSQIRVRGAPESHAKTRIQSREVVAAVWGDRPLAVHTRKPSGSLRNRL
ncbi:MAG: hypothetical protein ACRERE_03220 [Candidatus Entotheonellia bacterium]